MGKMKKRVLAALCVTMISGGTMLYAAPGKPDIAVYLNNVLQKQAGLSVEGETYLPAQQLVGGLQALMFWDESAKAVRVYKPNVNIALLDDQGKIFGKVRSGVSNKFSVLVQVDSLKTDISDLKIIISDPEGKTENIDAASVKDKKDSFWFKSAEFSSTFNAKGNYKIQVYLKDTTSKEWAVVSEIQISTI
ncbi:MULTISPECIES: copper amine oxidase [unclassified Paenibacillus]|uniref:copper amine oxidase n=1 Tax=unclassified Paenibacillus TaxID=185978 RepID=UPI0030F8A94C